MSGADLLLWLGLLLALLSVLIHVREWRAEREEMRHGGGA